MDNNDGRGLFPHLHALIAEDDALIAFDIEQTLVAELGMRVSVAHTLTEGLALARSERPHIAILDFDLDGSGVEPLARMLVEAGSPVIFVSGYGAHPLECLAAGLKLEKPHSADDLVAMVLKAVERLSA